MSIVITEQEMIERYVDGLKKASSRAKEIIQADTEQEKPQLFVEFIAGIKVAAGSSHQLFHAHQNTEWLRIRDLLEKIIDVGQTVPVMTKQQNGLWFTIKQSLDSLCDKGQKLFLSKPMARQDLLFDLDQRMKNAPNLVSSPIG